MPRSRIEIKGEIVCRRAIQTYELLIGWVSERLDRREEHRLHEDNPAVRRPSFRTRQVSEGLLSRAASGQGARRGDPACSTVIDTSERLGGLVLRHVALLGRRM